MPWRFWREPRRGSSPAPPGTSTADMPSEPLRRPTSNSSSGGTSPMTAPPAPAAFSPTRRGRLTLVFLCAGAFFDFVDVSIVNVALPSIRHDLHFSIQNLQWVLSGYVLTYGGFLLLGGRAADLLGRRRIVVAGTALFALSSMVCGLAQNSGTLVAGRLVQGLAAAMMSPAALSILST